MTTPNVQAITEQIREKSEFVDVIFNEASQVVVGQKTLIERILLALLCNGHVLLEGLPGLAKTLTIKTMADMLHVDFQRIQFTPDLLPADLVGTMIFNQKTGDFIPKKGPIFTNIVLADEISPDSCRLWDRETNKKLDKDRFRRDLGDVTEAYTEVATRLGILQASAPQGKPNLSIVSNDD